MMVILFAVIAVSFTSCTKDDKDDPITPTNPTATVYQDNGDGTVTIIDKGEGTGTVTLSSDKIWLLDGLVFVNDGQTLTIDAGTVIKGLPGQETDASALVVARGAKIMAEGTASEPIIFTAKDDDLQGSVSMTDRGLWGGLIVLGKAGLNSTPGETAIEGIPTSEPRGIYGGNQDNDNSGVIRYVSVRHGGTNIGEGNEINGITLGGVGSETIIEYVEIIANKDDGIEFFGGVPNVRYALVAYCGDDCFDYDEGFRGFGQFWVAIQDASDGDRIGEHDGGTDPETATPYATPTISNVTYIGRGEDAGKKLITFRDNAGGFYLNSIFVNQAKGVDIELLKNKDCSYDQFVAGNLKIENNIFWNINDDLAENIFKVSATGDSLNANGEPVMVDDKQLFTVAWQVETDLKHATFAAKFSEWNNSTANPGIIINPVNPVPTGDVSGANIPTDAWFMQVDYKGAFAPDAANWAASWTETFKQ